MPKKRHQNRYSKPQSTPPALLSSTAARRNDSHHDDASRGVNELLADLRRSGLSAAGQRTPDAVRPTVHPAIRQILQIPETPPPRPRRPVRVGPGGARLPAGPAPPRSWLSAPERAGVALQRSAVEYGAAGDRPRLPGMNLPARGSLIDMVLRRFALDWEWQRAYCQYHLYELPTHLRVALLSYLVMYTSEGVSLRDLQALLLPPPDVPEYQDDPALAPDVVNEDISHLDLSGSLGRSLKLRDLSNLLFPPASKSTADDLQESWDDAPSPGIPRPLLPSLTHLSLALNPTPPSSSPSNTTTPISWRHLLALAPHLANLTHLSLAFWPEPALTPNARLATVASPVTGRPVPYGGTGPYSHSLDADADGWAEQVLVLRRLSRALYGLEWLDLTGCGEWFPALWASAGEGDAVDWVGGWGRVGRLVMYPGWRLGGEGAGEEERGRYWELVDWARRVERHVRGRRAVGRGGWVVVETGERGGEI